MSAYIDAMRRYATFSGRSTRTEFWYYHLVLLALAIGGLIIDAILAGPREVQPLVSAVNVVAHYIPSLAIIVRRLHDLEKSGWLVLTCLIPLVGIVAFIVIGSTPSKPHVSLDSPAANVPVSQPSHTSTDQQIEGINKLAALRSSGAITNEEFERMKADIFGTLRLHARLSKGNILRHVFSKAGGTKLIKITRRILMMLGTCLSLTAGEATAGEQNYYKGNSWEIGLNTPDAEGGKPFCAFRSTAWTAKSVAIEFTLVGLDEIFPSLRVTKENWNLPTGQTTNVGISNRWAGGVTFVAKVVNGDELYGELPKEQAQNAAFVVNNILGTTIRTIKAAPLVVLFEGNEPLWLVPAVAYGEAISLGSAFDDCVTALKQLGPSLFKSAEVSATSPFARPPNQNNEAAPPAPANRSVLFQDPPPVSALTAAASTSSWAFEKREEDWGDTCYVETKQGDMTIGFMGAPGDAMNAFVDQGFTGSVKATWAIDNKNSYEADGEQSDYFGWHSFDGIPTSIITDAQNGRSLTIAGQGQNTFTLSLIGASAQFSEFVGCFGADKPN